MGIMKQAKDPNVVLFYGAVLKEPDYCHVTEFMDLVMKIKMLIDVVRGMETVHSFNIICMITAYGMIEGISDHDQELRHPSVHGPRDPGWRPALRQHSGHLQLRHHDGICVERR